MKLGLTMIVKDEAHVIGRCLDSVFSAGIIDYFVIVDTGSSDNTVSIIENKGKEYCVEGLVITKFFTDFAECRNIALDGLRGKCDLAFWIDADEVLLNKTNNLKDKLISFFDLNDYAWIEAKQGNVSFYRTSIFKLTEHTRWKGKVHEYVNLNIGNCAIFNELSIDVFSEGNSWKYEKQKFINYAKLLLEQIELEPDEPRWYYFLADTYRNIKEREFDKKAIDFYLKRISMVGGNEEEVYVSGLMVASLRKKLYNIYDYDTLLTSIYPTRIEHLVISAVFDMEQGNLNNAYDTLKIAMHMVGKRPEAYLFVDLKTYQFTVPFFMAVVCFHIGKKEESESAIKICEMAISYANETEKNQIKGMMDSINSK